MSGIIGNQPFGRSGVVGAFKSKGISDNADANAINIDSSERVMFTTQPMMLATGDNGADQNLTTSFAAIVKLDATETNCILKGGIGFTAATGVATFPLAGNYYIALRSLLGTSDGHTLYLQLDFSDRENRQVSDIAAGSQCSPHIAGIFNVTASTTVTFKVKSSNASGVVSNGKSSLMASIFYVGD